MAVDRHRRTRPILIAGAATIALGVLAIGWVAWPRGTTAISHDDALEEFRREHARNDTTDSSDAGTTGAENSSEQPSTPEPGVYTYTTEGNEQVKLGPFPSEERPLPDTVSIVVSATRAGTNSNGSTDGTQRSEGGASCFDWTLNLFAEHTEVTTWCIDHTGTLTMAAHTKHQSIGALSPTAALKCDPDVLMVPGHRETDLACDLRLEGGPAAITATITGTAGVAPTEKLTIDKGPREKGSRDEGTIETAPLEITYTVSGDLSGTWSEKLWLSKDMLPVRIVRHLELSGPATLTEHSTLELSHLSPTR